MKGALTILKERFKTNDSLPHVFNYLINSLSRKGLSIISIPVFTYLLTPADYGVINIFTSYSELLAIVLTLNCTAGVGRYYFEKDQNDFGSLLFTSMLFVLGLLIIFWILFSYNAEYIGSILTLPSLTVHYLIPSIMLGISAKYILSVFRATKQSNVVRNFGIQRTYVVFILTVIIILLLKENNRYMGIVYANVIAAFFFGFLTIRKLIPFITFKVKVKHIRYLLIYSIPLLPAYLSGIVMSYFDRIMLNDMVGSEKAGLYSFAYNIAGLQYMFSNAIMNSWIPKYYEYMNAENFHEHDRGVKSILRAISVITVGLILFGDLIGRILGSADYHDGLSILPLVVLGQFFVTYMVFYKNGVSFEKKTWISSLAIMTSAIINIVLNYIFIPRYGMVGAAYTTLLSYAIQTILMIVLTKRFLTTHTISLVKIIDGIVIASLVTVCFYWIVESTDGFIQFSLKLLVMGVASIMIFRNELRRLFINKVL